MSNVEKARPIVPDVIAFIVVMVASVIRLVVAATLMQGLWTASAELVLNFIFGICLLAGYTWARGTLIVVALINLIYFTIGGFIEGEAMLAVYEVATSICIILLLVSRPTMVRAIIGLVLYCFVLLIFGLSSLFSSPKPVEPSEALVTAPQLSEYKSEHNYTLSTTLPWKALSQEQGVDVWGVDVQGTDLRLARNDGSAFGLLFPLKFSNLNYSQAIGNELQKEIQHNWLSDLRDWDSYPMRDGFILSAEGKVNKSLISYVVFYKHLGNLGLYAVFWSDTENKDQLLSEATQFYEGISAPPIKERLQVLSENQVFQLNQEAVVAITVMDDDGQPIAMGSGFNIAPNGLIVTNLHTISNGSSVKVTFPESGEYLGGKVAAISTIEADLVILSLDEEDLPSIQGIKSVPVEQGDDIFVIGAADGNKSAIARGKVSQLGNKQRLYFEVTAPISQETSGGPVFNQFGEVIGIAEADIEIETEKKSYVIDIDQLENLFVLPQPITVTEFRTLLRGAEES